MNSIPPIKIAQTVAKQQKKFVKSLSNSNIDLSFEEKGLYKFGNRFVKIRFPR